MGDYMNAKICEHRIQPRYTMAMQDLARHLELGATHAIQEGKGLLAELLALQIDGCLHAECARDPWGAPLLAATQQRCADLLSRAHASAEAAEDRWGVAHGLPDTGIARQEGQLGQRAHSIQIVGPTAERGWRRPRVAELKKIDVRPLPCRVACLSAAAAVVGCPAGMAIQLEVCTHARLLLPSTAVLRAVQPTLRLSMHLLAWSAHGRGGR